MTPTVRSLVAGNWKMNGTREAGESLAREIARRAAAAPSACEIVLCPPATLLAPIAAILGAGPVLLGAQDCHAQPCGAFTGDIAAPMLSDAGCRYVIVGHSERRAGHDEDDAMVRAKAEAALAAGLTPIICVGETDAEREAGHALDRVTRQVRGSWPHAPGAEGSVIAYEPIWAIGTGKSAGPRDIAAMHRAIRDTVTALTPAGALVRVLYGGSVKAENAAEVFATEGVGGALVGGASLDAAAFWSIVEAASGA